MRNRSITAAVAAASLTLPGVVEAECLSANCYAGLEALIASVVVYGLLVLVLVVMLARRKWRRAGGILLAVVLALAVGVPLVSQGWQAWKLYAMERREVLGTLPDIDARVPLMISQQSHCDYGACMSVLAGAGARGVTVLPPAALEGLDLSQPIDLAEVPLEHWAITSGHTTTQRVLSAEDRQAEVARIDYIILTAGPFYLSRPGPVEAALVLNPGFSGLGNDEILRLGMAPLPSKGWLSVADLQFDLADLWLADETLAVPLAPLNTLPADNTNPGADAAAQVLCPLYSGVPDQDCLYALQ
ncbi:MAG: hypothetical protein WAT09_15085 [Paracoccaceae bacterium]